jgi:hypothetical protein
MNNPTLSNKFFSNFNFKNISNNVPNVDDNIIKKHMAGVWKANCEKCPPNMSEQQFFNILNNKIIDICKKHQNTNTNQQNNVSVSPPKMSSINMSANNSNLQFAPPQKPEFNQFSQSSTPRVGHSFANPQSTGNNDSNLDDALAKMQAERNSISSFSTANAPSKPSFLESVSTNTNAASSSNNVQSDLESTTVSSNQNDNAFTSNDNAFNPSYNPFENIDSNQNNNSNFESIPLGNMTNHEMNRSNHQQISLENERSAPDPQSFQTQLSTQPVLSSQGLSSAIAIDKSAPNQVQVNYHPPLPKPGVTSDIFLDVENENNIVTKENVRKYDNIIGIDSYWRNFLYKENPDGTLNYVSGNGSISTLIFSIGQNDFQNSSDSSDTIIQSHKNAGVIPGLSNLRNVVEVHCINGFCSMNIVESMSKGQIVNDNDNNALDNGSTYNGKWINTLGNLINPYIYVVIDEIEGNIYPPFSDTGQMPSSISDIAHNCNVKPFTIGTKAFAILGPDDITSNSLYLIKVSGSCVFNELRSIDKLTIRFYDSQGWPILWPKEDNGTIPTNQYITLSPEDLLKTRIGITLKFVCMRKSQPINLEMLN